MKLALGAVGGVPVPALGWGWELRQASRWRAHLGAAMGREQWSHECRTRGGRGKERQTQKGWVLGPAGSGRGQGNWGRSLMQALEGFRTLRVPSPLLQSWGWGDGKQGAGGWVLQNVPTAAALSLHPRPPGGAPPSFLPALERPPPARVPSQPHRWGLAGAWLSCVTLDKAQAYPHQAGLAGVSPSMPSALKG